MMTHRLLKKYLRCCDLPYNNYSQNALTATVTKFWWQIQQNNNPKPPLSTSDHQETTQCPKHSSNNPHKLKLLTSGAINTAAVSKTYITCHLIITTTTSQSSHPSVTKWYWPQKIIKKKYLRFVWLSRSVKCDALVRCFNQQTNNATAEWFKHKQTHQRHLPIFWNS